MVMPIRVSADDGRMTGEVFFAEFQAKCLCLFHGQAVVGCISWVKADDILVTFDINVTISLGDACRPGCLADATDVCQIEELVRLGELNGADFSVASCFVGVLGETRIDFIV